jgi:hypothetical protein
LEICRQCRQPTYCDRCGVCLRHGEPKVRCLPTRQWVVRARWLLRRKGTWTPWATTRVTAHGPLGALTPGYADLKAHRPRRVHVLQTDLEVLPVTGGKGV